MADFFTVCVRVDTEAICSERGTPGGRVLRSARSGDVLHLVEGAGDIKVRGPREYLDNRGLVHPNGVHERRQGKPGRMRDTGAVGDRSNDGPDTGRKAAFVYIAILLQDLLLPGA